MKNTQTITHKAKTYTFPFVSGSVQIPKSDILGTLDAVKLLLYFFAGCGVFRIEKSAFTLISRAVREWLDYEEGGLNTKGEADFAEDPEVLSAANKHKAHLAKKKTFQAKPEFRAVEKPNVRPESTPNVANIFEAPAPLEIILVPVDRILSNPHNSAIYDESLNPALLASVEEHGILVPIRLTREYVLIDGHQRVMAAKESGHKVVPAIIMDLVPENHLESILEHNRHREKTIMERLREYRAYLQIEKAKASERAGTRTDLGQDLSPGENFGKSRDHAAKKVNLSGTCAELGLRVLEEIEKWEKSSKDSDRIARMKVALNKSVLGAAKMAKQIGWMDASVKSARRKAQPKAPKMTQKAAVLLFRMIPRPKI